MFLPFFLESHNVSRKSGLGGGGEQGLVLLLTHTPYKVEFPSSTSLGPPARKNAKVAINIPMIFCINEGF